MKRSRWTPSNNQRVSPVYHGILRLRFARFSASAPLLMTCFVKCWQSTHPMKIKIKRKRGSFREAGVFRARKITPLRFYILRMTVWGAGAHCLKPQKKMRHADRFTAKICNVAHIDLGFNDAEG